MPIYLNREEEIKGKAPLEFYGNGQNLKDWEIQGRTSENLIENYVTTNEKSRYVTVLYAELDLKPNTTYTLSLILNEGYNVYFNEKCFSNWSAFTGDGTRKVFTLTTRSDLAKNNTTYTSGKGWWILKNNQYQSNYISVSDFQIVKGTYTSETIPPYEPYGGVGVRTENLFDISTDLIPHLGFSSSSGGIVSIKSTNNAIGFYVKCQPDKYYTLSRATNVNNRFSMGFTADEPVDGTSLLSYTPFETSDTSITALSPSNANYLCAYLTNQNDPITDDLQLMLTEGSTAPDHYIPYGYKIPVRVEGENLFDGEWKQGTTQYPTTYNRTSSKNIIDISPEAKYTIALSGSSVIQFALVYHDAEGNTVYDSGWKDITVSPLAPNKDGATSADILLRRNDNGAISPDSEEVQNLKVQLYEGTYTASTIPPYEVNLYTDHQLMDGDSISLSSTQINIPTLNTHNILTVPTRVQPSNITITLPQTETEITKILGPLINPRYDITDAYFGNLQVFTVWDTYTGPLPTTLYTTDWGLVDYKIYGTADGAGIKTKNLYNYNASGAVSLNLYPSEENGKLLSGQNNVSIIFAVKPDTVYSIYKLSTTRFRWACYAAAPQEGDEATSFSSSVSNTNIMLTFVTDSNAAYAVVFIKASSDSIDRDVLLRSVVVVEGPYAAQDVPYGYKIPMRSQNSVVDIYIGDTPLGENEYVSYSEQKIYRYINGVLTPTDPPKELPTITTINGNTTIDTTLEEKQYITSDNKVYCVKNGGRYLLNGSGLRPDNFYSKYRKGGT